MDHSRITGLALAGLLALTACGGGSVSEFPGYGLDTEALNEFEAGLVGSYTLTGFELFEEGGGLLTPDEAASWSGSLSLEDDHYGTLSLSVHPVGEEGPRTCEREFSWVALSGRIEFRCAEAGGDNAFGVWSCPFQNCLDTEFSLPTNRPDCGLFLVEDGHEHFTWVRADL